MTYYTVVTFGSPRGIKLQDSYSGKTGLERAMRDAREAMGSGTCTAARVYECDTRELARTADISEVRSGERIVGQA